MAAPDPPNHSEDRYQPMALVGVTMIALLGFAVFFLSFLVAPLAILIIFYVGFAASDRAKPKGPPARPAPGPEARRQIMERADEKPPPASTGSSQGTLSRLGA